MLEVAIKTLEKEEKERIDINTEKNDKMDNEKEDKGIKEFICNKFKVPLMNEMKNKRDLYHNVQSAFNILEYD